MERLPGSGRVFRLAVETACVLVVASLLACMGDTRPRISIEWGVSPEVFEGADVEIDGKVVGKLKKFGEATRTAFPMDKGEHTVRVLHPQFECRPFRFDAQFAGQKQMVLLDFEESASAGKPAIYMR